jgi:hypothetical protein
MSLNTFDRAKAAQQFVPVDGRPGCGNCEFRSKYISSDFAPAQRSLQCMKGGFFVSALAICSEHEPRLQPIPPLITPGAWKPPFNG